MRQHILKNLKICNNYFTQAQQFHRWSNYIMDGFSTSMLASTVHYDGAIH